MQARSDLRTSTLTEDSHVYTWYMRGVQYYNYVVILRRKAPR
jgi:hypothetical protein